MQIIIYPHTYSQLASCIYSEIKKKLHNFNAFDWALATGAFNRAQTHISKRDICQALPQNQQYKYCI